MPNQRSTPSGLELLSEVSYLATGAGIITFTLAPLALPALALALLATMALLIPLFVGAVLAVFVGAVLAAPVLVVRRWRRSRDRPAGASKLAGLGAGEAATTDGAWER